MKCKKECVVLWEGESLIYCFGFCWGFSRYICKGIVFLYKIKIMVDWEINTTSDGDFEVVYIYYEYE